MMLADACSWQVLEGQKIHYFTKNKKTSLYSLTLSCISLSALCTIFDRLTEGNGADNFNIAGRNTCTGIKKKHNAKNKEGRGDQHYLILPLIVFVRIFRS